MPPTLLDLPPELRTQVYEIVLLETPPPVFRFSLCIYTNVPVLLQVNQQIRDEASGEYYGKATFELLLHQRGLRHFTPWTHTLPKPAKQHLLSNRQVNIRIIIDNYDKTYYSNVSGMLGAYALRKEGGWYITVEHYGLERAPASSFFDVAERRKETGAERAARKKAHEERKRAGVVDQVKWLADEMEKKRVKEGMKVLLRPVMEWVYKGVRDALAG
ncbi:hypothetical protein B0A55_03080 [Friedmanniomyces simplex]|uniref:F-box domain-containing protein n=1 Tax=Friedmanniomyces simplex TaxID=329884 RepID=A0A4U0XKZ0_9PEZI|nr:hypothetical protein B0A55_03080 [Friedmanniomyces simplex]